MEECDLGLTKRGTRWDGRDRDEGIRDRKPSVFLSVSLLVNAVIKKTNVF